MLQEQQYTIERIAEELGASVKVIRRYVASGQLPASQIGTKYKIAERASIQMLIRLMDEGGLR